MTDLNHTAVSHLSDLNGALAESPTLRKLVSASPTDFTQLWAVMNALNIDEFSPITNPAGDVVGFTMIHNRSSACPRSLGGCRIWNYDNIVAAGIDAANLAYGMTLKAAMAGLPLAGGKTAIMSNAFSGSTERDAFFAHLGDQLERMGGRYYTAEDVGTKLGDMEVVHGRTNYVVGLQGRSGDPAPFTARGVLRGIEAAVRDVFGADSLSDLTLLVQGAAGAVGRNLIELLIAAKPGQILLCDINGEVIKRQAKRLQQEGIPYKIVRDFDVLNTRCDVYVPCHVGPVLDLDSAKVIQTKIIAGSANVQIDPRNLVEVSNILQAREVTYVPDFVNNAGGLINATTEVIDDHYDVQAVNRRVDAIGDVVTDVLAQARSTGIPPGIIAEQIARRKAGLAQDR